MIKFEISEHNPSVLRHLAVALTAIAADCDGECASQLTPPPPVNVAAFPPPAPEPLPVDLTPPAPVTWVEPVELAAVVPPPPLPTLDDDNFPDPPQPVPAPPTGVELDSKGLPWDARIHASTKTKCKDGTWKNKPGADQSAVAAVTAELSGVQAIPAPPVVASSGPTTFADLIKQLTPLLTGGKLTAQQVNEQCQTHGLPNCNALANRADLIPTVWSQICLIAG